MNKPSYISLIDWQLVKLICIANPEEPYLVAAIGWHETHWGTIGAGPGGWHLGYGYYGNPVVAAKYKGLEKQLRGAHSMIADHFIFPVTLQSVTNFAVNYWKSSVPTAWAKSVYSLFVGLTTGVSGVDPNTFIATNFRYREFFSDGIEPPAEYFPNVLRCAVELQKVRDIIGRRIFITSAYRTPAANQAAGGTIHSRHLTALAVDTHAENMDIRIYLVYLVRYTNFDGFCIGSGVSPRNLIHTDFPPEFWVDVYK